MCLRPLGAAMVCGVTPRDLSAALRRCCAWTVCTGVSPLWEQAPHVPFQLLQWRCPPVPRQTLSERLLCSRRGNAKSQQTPSFVTEVSCCKDLPGSSVVRDQTGLWHLPSPPGAIGHHDVDGFAIRPSRQGGRGGHAQRGACDHQKSIEGIAIHFVFLVCVKQRLGSELPSNSWRPPNPC